jgi:hypothetical protein
LQTIACARSTVTGLCDQVFLTYLAYAQPAVMDVAGPDIQYCRRSFAWPRPVQFSALKRRFRNR